MSKMPTGVALRGGVYQLRIGAPKDLQAHYAGPDAWRGSLRTSDRPTAIRLAHERLAEFHAEFERLRREAKPQWTPCSPKLAAVLAERIRYTILHGDDERRAANDVLAGVPFDREMLGLAPLSEDPVDRFHQTYEHIQAYADALGVLVAMGDFGLFKEYARHETDEMGLPPVDWAGHGPELAKVARALVGAYQDCAARQRGALVETPPPPGTPAAVLEAAAPPEAGETLRDVIEDWKSRTRAKPNAIQRTERAMKLFEEAVGVVPLTALKKADGAKFVAFLRDTETRGFGDSTAANHAAAVNAVMNVAVKVGKLDRNPFDLSFEIKDADQRVAWTLEELRTIYTSSLFRATSQYPVVRGVEPLEAAMLLRALLWSGARVGELAQLQMADVSVRDGIQAMQVHDEVGAVKNVVSHRFIPVAQGLADAGFADYIRRRQKEGGDWLFPSLNRGSTAPGDVFGKWFARFRDAHGLPAGPLNGTHRYRHLMRSTLASMNIGPDIADALTGHAVQGSAGRTVYTKVALKAVKEAVDKLDWRFETKTAGEAVTSHEASPVRREEAPQPQ